MDRRAFLKGIGAAAGAAVLGAGLVTKPAAIQFTTQQFVAHFNPEFVAAITDRTLLAVFQDQLVLPRPWCEEPPEMRPVGDLSLWKKLPKAP